MKKLLFLAILGGVGYLVYRQYMASQAEQDLWAEATAAPELRSRSPQVSSHRSTGSLALR